MKLFWLNVTRKRNITPFKYICLIIFLQSCATNHSQFGSKEPVTIKDNFDNPKTVSHTFYLVGDAGNADELKAKQILKLFEERLKKADTNSTLLFLGDNIYPLGMPPKDSPDRKTAEEKLNIQLALSKNFKGKTIFIPGNHDWYNGVEGLKEQERLVNEYLKEKKSFLPRKNCGIDHLNINDNVALIVIDSQWYLEDWDKHPTINTDCDIKSREQFFDELESRLNDNQKKTTILAIHHPLMSNGTHGGEFSLKKHLFPIEKKIPMPVIGTIINLLRKTSGISPQDLQNKKYNAFVKRVKTLIQNRNNVVVVSGHDHNLQYIDKDNIKQIISGAGSKEEAARAINENDFSFGHNGYAVLEVLGNGASKVSYYGADSKGKEGLLYKQQPTFPRPKPNLREYPNNFPTSKDTSVYTTKMTTKGGAYRFLWGKHYRKIYSTPIKAQSVSLDTLYGGLTPTISGGGHQSKSLRLVDKEGKEYVMRALKKSATRFLQSVAFKDQSVEKDFRDTYAEDFIMDFYTTAHPYTPFIVSELADRVGISHSNPKLFYVPKQNRLALFNEEYGDELYMIEERPMSAFKDLKSFGKPDKIISTDDVLANIRADEKYEVDEPSYIRARIFDMLIGDWDRHADQWRWGEYKENGKVIYRPIPRDRDQAFSRYDGTLLSILMNFPALRHMRSFDDKLDNVKWFNREAYALDLAFITKSDEKVWSQQAKYITDNLSNSEIDKAFEKLPKEVKDASIEKIKSDLKARKKHLEKYAHQYYKVLQKTVLIVGTDKKDRFVITRDGDVTKVEVYRIKKDREELIRQKTYHSPETRELWVYGLDDDDIFEVKGEGRRKLKIRLLGGQDHDTYDVESSRKIRIYDSSTKDNTVVNTGKGEKMLSDSYLINTYDYEKPKYNVMAGYPLLGFNPDDGVKIGARVNYTVNGFNRFPYSQRHVVGGNYYFATSGYELFYKGVFPHQIGKWNFVIDALYTSPNFSVNYFGIGNETENPDDDIDMDYNRVKIRRLKATPSLQWTGEMGGSAIVQASFERISVDRTAGRFVSQPGVLNPDVFDYKNFVDLSAKYTFENYDNPSNATLGMIFSLMGGYTININETDRKFPYAEGSLGFTYKISTSGNWMLATLLKGKALFDDDFEFYQAATVGGDTDLRGLRNQRFSGKQSFYQSTDLRWNLGKIDNGVAPLRYGVFGGFDYGRVWVPNEESDKWHQAYGGGIWINGVNLVTGKLSLFNSADGLRVSAGLGFGF